MPATETMILVNDRDEQTGTMEKMETHRQGLLHRAFSVFIMDSRGRLLLQRRAAGKYHCAGLWSNTCCGHPRPGEAVEAAARRRLQEEMGFSVPLRPAFELSYRLPLENGLTEHEYDHVFVGLHDGPVNPDLAEVGDHAFRTVADILDDMTHSPGLYTPWFALILPRMQAWVRDNGPVTAS
ncbi:MAG: isopentenyl-diphosphate Delta-isomerase [Pseudomonadota bacterium]|nr:isopentenyl-diphosphate Delta-isomerase [Pseudomonadota bacterium]